MKKNNTQKYILNLEKKISNKKKGLPEDIFLFTSRITPLINVDLLIKDKKLGTLLAWRNKGEKYPAGWHVPGGIIRFKEKIHNRIKLVAKNELKINIIFKKKPIAINEIHLNQKNRSHFISLLFSCKLKKKLNLKKRSKNSVEKSGEWMWFKKAPKNLIKPHKIYKKFLNFTFTDFV
jgi:colanic acid biosynthesis protein WcaH